MSCKGGCLVREDTGRCVRCGEQVGPNLESQLAALRAEVEVCHADRAEIAALRAELEAARTQLSAVESLERVNEDGYERDLEAAHETVALLAHQRDEALARSQRAEACSLVDSADAFKAIDERDAALARIALLDAESQGLAAEVARLSERNAALTVKCDMFAASLGKADAEVARLGAENKRMRDALEYAGSRMPHSGACCVFVGVTPTVTEESCVCAPAAKLFWRTLNDLRGGDPSPIKAGPKCGCIEGNCMTLTTCCVKDCPVHGAGAEADKEKESK